MPANWTPGILQGDEIKELKYYLFFDLSIPGASRARRPTFNKLSRVFIFNIAFVAIRPFLFSVFSLTPPLM
jgi:hypothetical protein